VIGRLGDVGLGIDGVGSVDMRSATAVASVAAVGES
jgi:hypothetical protein